MLIATPNVTVDRTLRLPELRPGHVLRPGKAVVTAGGKGINVARVSAAFGRRATLAGFEPDQDVAVLRRLLAVEPLDFVGVPVPGEVRVATIYLEQSGRVTVLNEPGPAISAEAWEAYAKVIAGEAATGRHRTLVCSGSLPPGVPDDAYGRLVTIGRRHGVRVVVDAARSALAAALAFAPDIVTPNLAEAEGVLTGHLDESVSETGPEVPLRACDAVRRLCARGAKSAAVTAGAAGTAFGDSLDVFWIPAVPIKVINPIGAGDSFVGGLVEALETGSDPVAAAAFAVGTASASVEQELAGGVDPERARQLAAQVAGGVRGEGDLRAEAHRAVA